MRGINTKFVVACVADKKIVGDLFSLDQLINKTSSINRLPIQREDRAFLPFPPFDQAFPFPTFRRVSIRGLDLRENVDVFVSHGLFSIDGSGGSINPRLMCTLQLDQPFDRLDVAIYIEWLSQLLLDPQGC